MGRPLFVDFLDQTTGIRRAGAAPGVHLGDRHATWDELLRAGRALRREVRPSGAYLIDPSIGLDAFVALFAIATRPDTVLVWAGADMVAAPQEPIAPGLSALPWHGPLERPLWGIMTSGSAGTPKLPVGYADRLELAALHYDAAMFRPAFDRPVDTFATCLPLRFSAAFFMTVLPALMLRRDLLVFEPHDWRPLAHAARDATVVCQAVPSVVAAGSLSMTEPADMSRVAIIMGAGYVTADRVATIRRRFHGARLANIYGTAETGAVTLDWDPGTHRHVGRPIPGKPVWIEHPDGDGTGLVATAGPDCRDFTWVPGEPLMPTGNVVRSTDYGHFDEDGCLYLDGRVDGGEKVHGVTIYPRRVERHLLDLPGVVDVRVFVRTAPGRGEQVVARVVGRVGEPEVRQHCATLGEAERPAVVECIPEENEAMAYTAHGKLRTA